MAARHEELCYEEKVFMYFLGCKGLSNDDVEVAGGTVLQGIRPGAGFKTAAISLKKRWGGYRRTTPMLIA